MPSARTSLLIGVWVIFASLIIADSFIYHSTLLNSILPWLSDFVNVMIFVLIPIVAASWLLDWRATRRPPISQPSQLPNGVRSASGQQLSPPRPRLRLRRDKRAEKLETIVVRPENIRPAPARTAEAQKPPSSPSLPSSSGPETTLEELVVEQQLEEIERGIAKLEEELQETAAVTPASPEDTRSGAASISPDQQKSPPPTTQSAEEEPSSPPPALDEEEVLKLRSDLQAVQQLLEQLEEKRKTGEVSPAVYNRLRAKYLKQKAEIEAMLAGTQ